jgi:hypothetical protein
MSDLEDLCRLKSRLLADGCAVAGGLEFPEDMLSKEVHLYAHSSHRSRTRIPDDLLLQAGRARVVARIRYNPASPIRLSRGDEGFVLVGAGDRPREVSVLRCPAACRRAAEESDIGSVCSMLGVDLIGVIPSNSCSYFGQGTQCRFCEIMPTYLKQVRHPRARKRVAAIVDAVMRALDAEPARRHLAITSGNLASYDQTAELLAEIAESLRDRGALFGRSGDMLATLMPPRDLRLIERLRDAGYNRIYFALEVHDRRRFATIGPGKDAYGYDRIVDALSVAVDVFGRGNVFTNYIYGLQSHDMGSERSFDHANENRLARRAVEFMLGRNVVPAFTVYHESGDNQIGPLALDSESMWAFFRHWGERLASSGIVESEAETVIFGPHTLSNTLFNDAYRLASERRRASTFPVPVETPPIAEREESWKAG